MLKMTLNPFRIPLASLLCKPARFKVKLLVLVFFALFICSLAPRALALSAATQTTAAPATPAPEEHGPSQKPVEPAKPFGLPITNSMIAS